MLRRLLRRAYVAYRGRINDAELKNQTIEALQKYLDKVDSLSEEQLKARPLSTKWNGQEIAFHAVNVAKGTFRICEGLRKEQDLPDVDRSAVGRTKEVTRDDLIQLCRRVLSHAGQFDFVPQSRKTCGHPLVGRCNFKQWLVVNLIHLQRHYQGLLRTIPTN